jgi:hypothetical protein
MTLETGKTRPMSHWKLSVGMMVLIVLLLGTMVWLALRSPAVVENEPILPSTHPLFGNVFETTGVYGDPVRVPNASSFRPMSSLTIGPNRMDWMKEVIDGKPAGYLYLWDPLVKTSNVWSFAPCAKSSLAQVTKADLGANFCSAEEDDKGRATFGRKWIRSDPGRGPRSTAIWVDEGNVILARHVCRPSAIYVLEMTRQYRDSMRVRYVQVME